MLAVLFAANPSGAQVVFLIAAILSAVLALVMLTLRPVTLPYFFLFVVLTILAIGLMLST